MTSKKRVLYILDLDRTLLDTNTMMRPFVSVCDAMQINSSVIRQVEQESARHGQSFQAMEILKTIASTEVIEEFKARLFTESEEYSLLYEDAQSLLDSIAGSSQAEAMLLTYGHNDWQRMKIQAAGLMNIHAVITKEVSKSDILNRWVKPGCISVPGMGDYDIVFFVDDKPISFEGLSPRYKGYCIIRGPGQSHITESLPAHVQIIQTLDEVEMNLPQMQILHSK